jgi:hypothetical protein
MKRFLIILSLASVALLCCQCTTSKELRQAKKGAKSVPYTVLQNYYVRNDVNTTKLQRLIIDNEQDFNSYFGPAAVMGGLPTDINWKTQYVIAVVLPETTRTTNVIPKDVQQSPGNVIFYYALNHGRKTGYNQVPFLAVAVNRAADAQNLQVFFIEK